MPEIWEEENVDKRFEQNQDQQTNGMHDESSVMAPWVNALSSQLLLIIFQPFFLFLLVHR